ncbi:MAG: 5'-3' exonuclease H3TH domain-containing protein [Kiritimatiellae bacterium]|nr:5'-3' exonuclease H3TH domain-containing protein [Kiritimatiellia bacterium]
MTSRIVLVDALGMIYRAFYAVTGLSTEAGRPTNAVFGFIRMLGQINRVWRPTHGLVVFDGGIPEERKKLLSSYKAQRPPMPDQLRVQLEDIREYLDAAGIGRLRMEGREADDILASAAKQAEAAGFEVLVASSDKDLMQITGGNIALITPGKIENRVGPEEVYLKTGVHPAQIVEWLALTGDSSDNIPGVRGIGAKTAARLLGEWGSLQGIFQNLERLKPERMRALLENCRADVFRNVQIITLDKNIKLPRPVEETKLALADTERLRSFYSRMEFHSMAAAL